MNSPFGFLQDQSQQMSDYESQTVDHQPSDVPNDLRKD